MKLMIMSRMLRTMTIGAIVVMSVTGCKSRDEKVSDAIRDGNKKVAAAREDATDEVGKAQLKLQAAQLDSQEKLDKSREALRKEEDAAAAKVGQAKQDAEEDVHDAMHD